MDIHSFTCGASTAGKKSVALLYYKRVSMLKNDEYFPVVIVARYLHELILHQNKLLLDRAGPNGIAPVAGMKGNPLPRLGITTHEYSFSSLLTAKQ